MNEFLKEAKALVKAARDNMNDFQKTIKYGQKVTILVPNGIGRNGVEYKHKTGKAVMLSANGGWVLNMGGRHGTPGIATEENTVYIWTKK